MKKALILTVLVVGLIALMSGMAMAGGWSTVSTSTAADEHDTTNPDGVAVWNPTTLGAPHGNFSTSSNRCRVCHAVHMADPMGGAAVGSEVIGTRIVGPTAWRLLRNKNRTEECYYCHGPDGATDKQPFRDRTGVTFRGEHTLGSTVIPDSNAASVPGGTLTCGTCHNVHAAGVVATATISGSPDSSMAVFMAARLLKDNPNPFNGQSVGTNAGAANGAAGSDPFTKFCSDCHDKNPNWDVNTATSDTSTPDHVRSDANGNSNTTSHVQGPNDDGMLEVYGESKQVANYTTAQGNPYYANLWGYKQASDPYSNFKDTVLTASARWGCRGCHRATDQGNIEQTFAGSAWPHRTVGAKLLFDDYIEGTVQTTTITNDASRVLPKLDQLCTKCHRNNGVPDASSTIGVGVSF